MSPTTLAVGTVVQLGPTCKNPMFTFCFMVVTEPHAWGTVGYVQTLGENREPGGIAHYRASWDEMEFVGRAQWIAEIREPDHV